MRTLLACLLVAASLSAQDPTHLSPFNAAATLGNSNNSIPFSWTPTAYQQVHDRESFSSTTPAVVMRLRLRMANNFTNRAGHTIDVELFMANSPNGAATASSVFASNIEGNSEMNVFTRRQVNLPTVPDNAWAVAPFPFDLPFVYTGVHHLSWRAVVWGNSNNNAIFTYPLDAWSGSSAGASIPNGPATGCRSALGTADATHTATIGSLGGQAVFAGNAGASGSAIPVILTLGTRAHAWGGVPLPLDLAAAGAPGCFIRNDVLVMVTSQTTTAGSASIALPIPNDPALTAGRLYSQLLFVDALANSLGVFTSNGLLNRIGGPVGLTRIYASGTPTATSGTVGTQYGMAIGLN